jgi:outer membrane protein assembly factor BamE
MRQLFKLLFALFIICSTLLAGCGASVPAIKPFKMDIQQGNVVTSKMLLQLRPGMTKSQVRFIMGTPLVVDSFHKDRWDYFYQMRQAGKIVEQRRVILDFDKDLLTKVRGDVVPEGTAGAASAADASTAASGKSIEPKAKEEGILEKLKFWKTDEKAAIKPTAVAPAAASTEAAAQAATKSKEAEKKSWTDKLKFWKKDEPNTAPLEAPAATLPDVPAADVTDATQDVPSVLAVPIGAAVPDAAPAVELPAVDTPQEEEVKTEPLKVEPAPMPEPPKVEPAKAVVVAPTRALTPAPVKAAPVVPTAPAIKPDEPIIFRMDRNLDTTNLESASSDATPNVTAPATPNAKPKAKKAESEPLPAETEPSFFDRMLEKIGF